MKWLEFGLQCAFTLAFIPKVASELSKQTWIPNLPFSVCLFKEANVNSKYETRCQVDWIVHTGLTYKCSHKDRS